MQTLVVYDSKFGNTERVAEAIARGVGSVGGVSVVSTTEATQLLPERLDLLLLGGPTQRRNMSPALAAYLDGVSSGSLSGISTATFDTRYRGSTLFLGSAAAEAAKRLKKAGASLVSAPESFYVSRGGPLELQTLEAGELERAEAWGRAVSAAALNEGSPS